MWSNALDRSRLSMNLLHFLEGTSWKEWTISWADVVTDISTVNKSIRGVVYISIWLGTWHLMQSDINNMHKLIGLKSWGEVEDGLFGDESNDSFNNKTRELDHLCCRFGDFFLWRKTVGEIPIACGYIKKQLASYRNTYRIHEGGREVRDSKLQNCI